jgi:hypothetical protein
MIPPDAPASAWTRTAEVVAGPVQAFPESLAGVPVWQLAVAIVLGVVSLLYGLKLFKGMVVVYAATGGVLVGGAVAAHFGAPAVIGSIVGAVILGALAWPMLKVSVSILAGVAGAVAGAVGVLWLDDPVAIAVAGGVGLVVGFVLGFLIFRAMIVFATAVLGAGLLVAGVVGLVMLAPGAREAIVGGLEAHRHLVPLLVGVPAVIGAVYQAIGSRGERKAQEEQ